MLRIYRVCLIFFQRCHDRTQPKRTWIRFFNLCLVSN